MISLERPKDTRFWGYPKESLDFNYVVFKEDFYVNLGRKR